MPINPFRANIFFDSCAFDLDKNEGDYAKKILDDKRLTILLSYSTRNEINHTNTPHEIKYISKEFIDTIPVNLTEPEVSFKKKILDVLTGNGKRENMKKDAEHIFEAFKSGNYFITVDKGILKKREEINSLGSCRIMLPSEFCNLVNHFESKNKLEQKIKLLHIKRDTYATGSDTYQNLDSEALELENRYLASTS